MRITHIPTGIVVQCQNERSQTQNKAVAMQILRSKLIELEERKRAEELAKERGEVKDVAWGSQIRSYVMHPVHDGQGPSHRARGRATSSGVLDGDIDEFIRDYLNRTAALVFLLVRVAGRAGKRVRPGNLVREVSLGGQVFEEGAGFTAFRHRREAQLDGDFLRASRLCRLGFAEPLDLAEDSLLAEVPRSAH